MDVSALPLRKEAGRPALREVQRANDWRSLPSMLRGARAV